MPPRFLAVSPTEKLHNPARPFRPLPAHPQHSPPTLQTDLFGLPQVPLRFLVVSPTKALYDPAQRLSTFRPLSVHPQHSPPLQGEDSFSHKGITLNIAAPVTLVMLLFQVAFRCRVTTTPPRRVFPQAASLIQVVSSRRVFPQEQPASLQVISARRRRRVPNPTQYETNVMLGFFPWTKIVMGTYPVRNWVGLFSMTAADRSRRAQWNIL